ncbi:MAG: Stp1/IreP family PP2C-type Ser/Thr phosphatase [Halanaerobiales bacterium]
MEFNVFTDKSKFRQINEDSFIVEERKDYVLAAVADGLGGHKAGNIASSIAVDFFEDYNFKIQEATENIFTEIVNVINRINKKIIKMSHDNPDYKGMGTTLSLVLIVDYKLYLGHVGDSRIYLLRNGSLRQLTIDDTLVQNMVDHERIKPEEVFGHPRGHILTQGLGVDESPEIETNEFSLKQGDCLLLCTDGLSDTLPAEKVEDILKKNLQKENPAQILGRKAIENEAQDNVTVLTGIIK